MRTIKLGLVILFSIAIASCGGWGEGGNTTPATYSISGAVSGATLAGVTINLTGAATASATTDAGGNYSFASLDNGSYTVTPSKTGYMFNPANSAVSVSGANVSGTNFTATGQLNDTGITASQCYQAASDVLVACNSAGATTLNNAQDGMAGRDANAATNSNTDGKLGFSFTAVAGGCVQDNVTGLMWEVKTADGGLRDWSKTYTNYDSTTALQKWNGTGYNVAAYVAPTQIEIDASTNSVGFKNSVNSQALCGYSDWRLPTADELQSIVDYGVASPGPAVDAIWFPNTQGSMFWSASPVVGFSSDAWGVSFGYGVDLYYPRRYSSSSYVRLVRAGQSPATPRYTVSADGQEVTDSQTNLIWRRCAEGMVFSGGTCIGTALPYNHEAALQRAATQASSTGIAWRLPNVKELSSIADKSLSNPAIDPTAFPATPASWFWSASPVVGNSTVAWVVNFSHGLVGYGILNYLGHGYALSPLGRYGSYYVRLVRAGQ